MIYVQNMVVFNCDRKFPGGNIGGMSVGQHSKYFSQHILEGHQHGSYSFDAVALYHMVKAMVNWCVQIEVKRSPVFMEGGHRLTHYQELGTTHTIL